MVKKKLSAWLYSSKFEGKRKSVFQSLQNNTFERKKKHLARKYRLLITFKLRGTYNPCDSFPLDYKPNRIPFSLKSKRKNCHHDHIFLSLFGSDQKYISLVMGRKFCHRPPDNHPAAQFWGRHFECINNILLKINTI